MKTYLLIIGFICSSILSFSQDVATDFSGNMGNQTRNPNSDYMNFVPNEVIIKFKDATPITTGSRVRRAGVSSVDKVMQAYGVTSLEKLFPSEQKPKQARIITDPQGKDITVPALDKIYKVSIPTSQSADSVPANIYQLIEDLKALPEVEYAEPNYIYSIDDLQPVGPVLTADDLVRMQPSKQNNLTDEVIPNDPLYSQQWYISAVKADSVWKQTTGDTTQVIGILDTGVDWNHPDLKNKIWTNPDEIPGNGIDDDGNGLIDDIRGWDFINNDNNPMDDNSHGTHVAGIAAAETNNGIGIAGVNWQAKIMPLKVFQSSGRGDAANIAKAIIYATNKGVTVINMSFGSYSRSMAMEDALANAYATTILVAAAGNDGLALETCIPSGQFFPACLSYVLGVQSPEASFSNYDCNGPTFSNASDLVNYEMKAPGTNVISTIPNGNYRVYQGTSMAAPIVSAAVSLYRKLIPYEEETNEFMWVKLIQATGQYLDINKALTIVPKPEVWFLNKVMVDTLDTDDRDGRVDAGETIQLWFRARNTGGQVDSVYWKIRLAEFEDTTTCNIVKSTSFLSNISPYATCTSESDPMKFIINPNVAHDRDITFDLSCWYKGATDTIVQPFVFTAENGEQLSGVMDSTLVLNAKKLWLVNESFRVGYNGHLIIMPGTKIKIYGGKYIAVRGRVTAIGKADSLIVIEGGGSVYGNGSGFIRDGNQVLESIYKYVKFQQLGSALDLGPTAGGGYANVINCTFIGEPSIHFRGINNFINNLVIRGNWGGYTNGIVKMNNFISSTVNTSTVYWPVGTETRFNNFVSPSSNNEWNSSTIGGLGWSKEILSSHQFNSFISDAKHAIISTNYQFSGDIQYMQNQYWGTIDNSKIKKMINDFWSSPLLPKLEYETKLVSPPDSCHGIVWKVLVNGKDAQDEVVEPVGVGKQRFDVYFNRPMDKTITPQVAFGVRYPFSSNTVNEDGIWSEDGRIYTVYKNIKLTTGDGINRIRVTGAKDLEGWEIPTEDMRFEFLINAATSASLEFIATPGLGKVNLEWNNNNLEDGLGYNMYRMEHINDSTLTEPVIINSSLITDTLYTDYSVVPNKKYYYLYKIVRTDLSETDQSKVVSAIPFTASKGDANGDLSVNVLDITSIVAYLLNHNPQPFIFEAADVNNDVTINVLDIVGVVNKVLNRVQSVFGLEQEKLVELFIENDTLFISSNTEIGGIQLDINGVNSMDDIQILKALDGFESGSSITSGSLRLIFYSMSGKSIPAGERIPLLKLKGGSEIVNPIFGDINSSSIRVNYIQTNVDEIHNYGDHNLAAEFGKNLSSSAGAGTVIPIIINEPVDEVVIHVINMAGQEVWTNSLKNPYVGEHLLLWNSGAKKGVFVCRLEIKKGNRKQISPVKKLIVH